MLVMYQLSRNPAATATRDILSSVASRSLSGSDSYRLLCFFVEVS